MVTEKISSNNEQIELFKTTFPYIDELIKILNKCEMTRDVDIAILKIDELSLWMQRAITTSYKTKIAEGELTHDSANM